MQLAAQLRVPIAQPAGLRSAEERAPLEHWACDLLVVVAYGLLLPPALLELPRLGCLNVHASLLPRWRGAAPIQRAILAGDRETGTTIMQMDEGLDTGSILLQQAVPILPDTTAGELTEQLAALGARLMLEALDSVAGGTLMPRPQA